MVRELLPPKDAPPAQEKDGVPRIMPVPLSIIAQSNGTAFYRGELAEKIIAFSRQFNGFLSADDLASFESQWVAPISVDYHDYTIWEIPPNGQGLVALMALNMLKDYSFTDREAVETITHRSKPSSWPLPMACVT